MTVQPADVRCRTIAILPDSAYVSQSVQPDTIVLDSDQSVYHTANQGTGLSAQSSATI